MSQADFDQEDFIETYVEAEGWQDGRDIETCRENARKYATALRNTDDRLGWFGWLREKRGIENAANAEPEDVRGFLIYLKEQGLSGPTRTQARSGISKFYQLMLDVGNPVAGLEGSWGSTTIKEDATGQDRIYLSKDEVELLIENAPPPTLRSTLTIKLLYQTGCRRMELAKAKIEQLDMEARELQVYGDKTDEWRTVTFKNSLRQPLKIWLDQYREDEPGWHPENPYLFPSASTGGDKAHLSGQSIRSAVNGAAERAGILEAYGTDATGQPQYRITPHILRHTFAVHAAENGVPAPHLKKILGHHSLNVTQIYTEIAQQDAVDMLKDRGPSI